MGTETLGGRIRFIRKDLLRLRLDAFAGKLSVTRGAVTNWERGGGISRKNLAAIANLAQTSIDWIQNGGETPVAVTAPEIVPLEDAIAITLQVLEKLRKFTWTDREVKLLAEIIREFYEREQSARASPQTGLGTLEIDIRQALLKGTLKT